MMNLAEYRRHSQSLADFLPWAALVGKGVILDKDGSFQRTARFRGPDLDSATPAELVAITGRLNIALRRLGSGWAIFIEAQRTEKPSEVFSLRSGKEPIHIEFRLRPHVRLAVGHSRNRKLHRQSRLIPRCSGHRAVVNLAGKIIRIVCPKNGGTRGRR